jgi:hypothetical protein
MSMPNPDLLLVATWANEETIATKNGAAEARHHASEDFDSARLRGGPQPGRVRSAIAWIKARLATRR